MYSAASVIFGTCGVPIPGATFAGEVKLADFGLSRIFGSPDRNFTNQVWLDLLPDRNHSITCGFKYCSVSITINVRGATRGGRCEVCLDTGSDLRYERVPESGILYP